MRQRERGEPHGELAGEREPLGAERARRAAQRVRRRRVRRAVRDEHCAAHPLLHTTTTISTYYNTRYLYVLLIINISVLSIY